MNSNSNSTTGNLFFWIRMACYPSKNIWKILKFITDKKRCSYDFCNTVVWFHQSDSMMDAGCTGRFRFTGHKTFKNIEF